MKRIVRTGFVLALAVGMWGCAGTAIEEGAPKDTTPGVSLTDPSVAPNMKPFKQSMLKDTSGQTKAGTEAPAK
jgi:hypothetical protein